MENTINELRKFAEWCEFKTTAALRQGIELAIENYIKEKQCDIHVVSNWVAVSDRLPDHIQKVIIYGKLESWSENETFTGVLNRAGGLNQWNTGGVIMYEVTWWMPDIKPPCY